LIDHPSHRTTPLIAPPLSSHHPSHRTTPLIAPPLSSHHPSHLTTPLISPPLSSHHPSHIPTPLTPLTSPQSLQSRSVSATEDTPGTALFFRTPRRSRRIYTRWRIFASWPTRMTTLGWTAARRFIRRWRSNLGSTRRRKRSCRARGVIKRG
jgi:hypothetical protein